MGQPNITSALCTDIVIVRCHFNEVKWVGKSLRTFLLNVPRIVTKCITNAWRIHSGFTASLSRQQMSRACRVVTWSYQVFVTWSNQVFVYLFVNDVIHDEYKADHDSNH